MGKCKAKAIQTVQAHSGIINCIQYPVQTWHIQSRSISRNMTYSKPETYSEHWFIQNPGVLKTVAYSKPKAYSDIYDEKDLQKSVL